MQIVSCIIPTYGRPELLIAVKSVVDQSYKGKIEIVVVDDSPHHHYENRVKSMATENRPVLYVKLKNRKGAPYARNVGWNLSKGNYTAFLDDDDVWYKTKIEKQVKTLEKHHDCPIVVCWSKDKRFGTIRLNRPKRSISYFDILKSFNLSSTSSYLTRKSLYELLGGFDESLPASQEYDLAIRYSKNSHNIICVQETLIEQNSTKGQISENWTRKIKGVLGIFKKYHKDYDSVDYIKTLGVISLFLLGFAIGNRIYKIIIPVKERYEDEINTKV